MPSDEWYQELLPYLDRALSELIRMVKNFLSDWQEEYGFRVEGEVSGRSKSSERIRVECERKGIRLQARELLSRDGAVGDLVGVRIVVRTLDDAATCTRAFLENFQVPDLQIEDKVATPTATGYRAYHLNGFVETDVRGASFPVPFEIQVKTLAQHAWGYYTHDSVYSNSAHRSDPRFTPIVDLQRALAGQLHAVDELQLALEQLTRDTISMIEVDSGPDSDVTIVSVAKLIEEYFGITDVSFAATLTQEVHCAEEMSMGDIAEILGASQAVQAQVAESFEVAHRRRPSTKELILALVRERKSIATD